jgi:hypothetical protein
MSLREHFAEYKEIVRKFYIAWVDSLKKFVGRKIPVFCKFNVRFTCILERSGKMSGGTIC